MTDIIEIPSEAVEVGRTCHTEDGYHVTFRIGLHLYGCYVGQPSMEEVADILRDHGQVLTTEQESSVKLKSL